jgi:hypothetical protein
MPSPKVTSALVCASIVLGYHAPAAATESIEFVGEHLPEIAMDNRYASLPLWNRCPAHSAERACFAFNAGYAMTHSGTLSIDGPMFAASVAKPLGERGSITAFAFFDDLALDGGIERRPLDVLFANPPLTLPAAAQFTGLGGSARDAGVGVAFRRGASVRFLSSFEWTAGLLWQRVALRNYAFDYEITAGPDTGTRGTLDYDTDYSHFTPFAGIAWPRAHGAWGLTPHLQYAMPLPRRGVVGHITGPEFDLAGNTATNGHGKHFGDPSLTAGFDLTYLPWGLTIDVGSTLSQAALEPFIHEGVQHNWFLSAHWFH